MAHRIQHRLTNMLCARLVSWRMRAEGGGEFGRGVRLAKLPAQELLERRAASLKANIVAMIRKARE